MYLEKINGSADLKTLEPEELPALCGELRRYLLDGLKRTGGHLASNLGAVELTVALHYVFDCPTDRFVFDVGHQAYIHKILTGRREAFLNLRQEGGISGFPNREESPCDAFGTGHASTSISAGLGLARARDISGGDFHVVCVIGDGALAGGMAYEALNDAGQCKTPLIVVLNDNRMSISETPGAVSRHLARLRIRPRYTAAKARFKSAVLRFPLFGKQIYGFFSGIKRVFKRVILPNALFEQMGVKYVGPIDGHNAADLISCFRDARRDKGPLLIHVLTRKGKGWPQAEDAPDAFHGVESSPQCTAHSPQLSDKEQGAIQNAQVKEKSETVDCALCTVDCKKSETVDCLKRCFSEAVGNKLAALAETDPAIVAITAGMAEGTGLCAFREKCPDRFFDVGIAEQHAVTLAAGMAAGGLKPFVAIYSTFLQRAYDQILHDVCLQNLPVVFLLDRAGVVGADGRTHQGIYDLSYLAAMPNAVVCAPADIAETELLLEWATGKGSAQCTVHSPQLSDNSQCTMHNAQLSDKAQGAIQNAQVKEKSETVDCGLCTVDCKKSETVDCGLCTADCKKSELLNSQFSILNSHLNSPIFIRYPKTESGVFTLDPERAAREIAAGEWGVVKTGKSKITVLCVGGRMLKAAREADEILTKKKIYINIMNARFVAPLDKGVLEKLAGDGKRPFGGGHLVVSMEDGVTEGGFGERVRAALSGGGCRFVPLALPVKSVEHCDVDSAFKRYGLDADGLVKTVLGNM
jgi:1-deoxy-D-xylulose-5-phosphate synthase